MYSWQDDEDSITEGPTALDLFTDRYRLIRRFAQYINTNQHQGKTLFLHGEGGNGKSLLLEYLRDRGCRWVRHSTWQELAVLGDRSFCEALLELERNRYLPQPVVLIDFALVLPRDGILPRDEVAGPLWLSAKLTEAAKALNYDTLKFRACSLAICAV
ncbi:hypothetical protein [Candidatus Cyanaurora vandensis]|uniref:hypothetical protein n=1 Tax=Candidatus Cyanaurora vandensis TaxID=2714958 RepID=UPI0025798C2F|nr:hypothetical protein [Candidatus Cyanaurora vandensis]